MQALEAELGAFPGMRMVFTQPIEMRVNEMIAGIRADLGIKLFGDDLDVLTAKAQEIEGVVRGIPGAADVGTEQITGQPLLSRSRSTARRSRATASPPARCSTSSRPSADARSACCTRVSAGSRSPSASMKPTAPTPRPLGACSSSVPVVIACRSGPWPRSGSRRDRRRSTASGASAASSSSPTCAVATSAGFVAEVERAIEAQVDLPPGYYVRFGGQFEHLERARARLVLVVPLALGLIFLLLLATYGRVLDAARVFTGVPFAAVGGILALWLRGMPFTISAAVGFVALSGVAVLGDMVLVSTIRQHLARGRPLGPAIEESAAERLRPVLMTALVASLGFVPMAVNTGVGAEVQRPLATVVIGGVLSSSFLTLFVLPVLYALVGRSSTPGVEPRQAAPGDLVE